MYALRHSVRRKGLAVWQILFCLTFLSFLCRAVIPVGYMPDSSGMRGDGKFAITFCITGGGAGAQQLSSADQLKFSPDEHAEQRECPYWLVGSNAVLPGQDALALVGTIFYRPVALSHDNQAQPLPSILGPPFGPRAPPSNLG